jgi:hypothetical protein
MVLAYFQGLLLLSSCHRQKGSEFQIYSPLVRSPFLKMAPLGSAALNSQGRNSERKYMLLCADCPNPWAHQSWIGRSCKLHSRCIFSQVAVYLFAHFERSSASGNLGSYAPAFAPKGAARCQHVNLECLGARSSRPTSFTKLKLTYIFWRSSSGASGVDYGYRVRASSGHEDG